MQPCAALQRSVRVSAAEAATAVVTTQTGLMELNKDTFTDFINSAGDTVVVVDFFTDWCGPCKLIYPELVKLSTELAPAAQIVKFNCNQANKELAKTLGIKVAPTFHLYKNGVKVADMTGAKVDKLRHLIEEQINQN
jgi:thioredoxin 1